MANVQEIRARVTADVADGVAGIKKFGNEVNRLPSALGKTDTAIVKTSKNFTGMSRVLQDLPFGFVAISNNLEQLLPAAGAAGLALSGLTAALTFASIGFDNWTRMFPDAQDKIKNQIDAIHKHQEALKNYVEVLDDVTKMQVLGNQNAQEELVHLKTLYDATQNLNIPIAKRKQLVDELQEQYPKYFANIKDEVILTGGARAAYEKLTTAILAAARARAGQDLLVGVQKDLITNERQQIDNNQKLSDLNQQITNLKKSGAKFTTLSLTGEERLTDEGAKLNKLQNKYNDLLEESGSLFKENLDLSKRARNLTGEITQTVEQNPDALLDPTGNIDTAKKKVEKKLKERPFLLPVEPLLPTPQKLQQTIGKDLKLNPVLLPVTPDIQKDAFLLDVASSRSAVRSAGAKLGGEMGEILGDVFQNKVNAKIQTGIPVEALSKFQEALKATLVVGSQLADVLGTAFGSFGQALVQGQNAMQAFFTSVKNSLSQIIGQLLKTIATAAILSAITGGVGGGGLSFVGALKGLLSVKPFARGGLAFAPTLGLVGEGKNISRSNPEVISPLSDLKKFDLGNRQQPAMIPAWELTGDTLRLWLKRANDTGRMFG